MKDCFRHLHDLPWLKKHLCYEKAWHNYIISYTFIWMVVKKKYMFSCSRQFRKALWACVTEIQGSYLLITLPMLLLTGNDKSYFQHLSACIWLHINRVSPPLACILQPTCFFLPLSFNIAICTAALSFMFTQSLRIDIITPISPTVHLTESRNWAMACKNNNFKISKLAEYHLWTHLLQWCGGYFLGTLCTNLALLKHHSWVLLLTMSIPLWLQCTIFWWLFPAG